MNEGLWLRHQRITFFFHFFHSFCDTVRVRTRSPCFPATMVFLHEASQQHALSSSIGTCTWKLQLLHRVAPTVLSDEEPRSPAAVGFSWLAPSYPSFLTSILFELAYRPIQIENCHIARRPRRPSQEPLNHCQHVPFLQFPRPPFPHLTRRRPGTIHRQLAWTPRCLGPAAFIGIVDPQCAP
ncbi:hypothetical protein LZ32DRAFT_231006 [Colletotrichum eremochloae]|nr:hypothetical protein LZ32DRAFT_231006 [Colletotrichum eremochloae]